MRAFSLAYLTLPGLDAMEQIRIAGETGYDYVSLRTIPMGLPGEPQLHPERDPALLRRLQKQMKVCGVSLLDIELVQIREDIPEDHRAMFEAGARLGARHVLSSVWTSDFDFAAERYASICDQAAQFGLTVNMEFPVVASMNTFAQTVEMHRRVNKPNLKVFIDTLYAHLDGLTAEALHSIPEEDYGIIHLCDCPGELPEDLTAMVRGGREYCGYGVADLKGILNALPERPCSIELPNLVNIERLGPEGHARRCLETAKALFEGE